MRRFGLAILLIAAVAVPRAVLAEPVVERDVVELAPAKGIRIDTIDIDNRLGDVRIEGHDKDSISILAVKRAPDDETVERLKVSLVPDPGGPVTIRTSLLAGPEARPVPAGTIRIDLVVKAPRSARVVATVWKGKVVVQGLDNGAELSTDDGDIDVSQVSGQVTTASAHGRHTFAQIYGAIDARAVEGDLDLDVVRGERLAAVVQAGHVVARHIRVRDVSVRVTRGSVSIEGDVVAGGSYRIAAYFGDVQVKLRGKAPLRVAARARSGNVNLPKRFRRQGVSDAGLVTGYLGSGRSPADLDLRTRVGSITVAEF